MKSNGRTDWNTFWMEWELVYFGSYELHFTTEIWVASCVPFIHNIRATFFHQFSSVFTDRLYLSSPIFLLRWKMKEFTNPGPKMKVPDFKPFNLVFQMTSLTIATTRKQILPSFDRKSNGSIFTIDSADSCALLVLDHSSLA